MLKVMEYVPFRIPVSGFYSICLFPVLHIGNHLHSLGQLPHLQRGRKITPRILLKIIARIERDMCEENFKGNRMLLLSYTVKQLRSVKAINQKEHIDLEMFSRGEKVQGQTIL